MPVVACIHHLEQPFLGHAEGPLRAAGLTLDERFLAAGDPLPDLREVDGIVAFGGAQSAVDLAEDSVLAAEAGCSARPSISACRCSASASAGSCSRARSAGPCGGSIDAP